MPPHKKMKEPSQRPGSRPAVAHRNCYPMKRLCVLVCLLLSKVLFAGIVVKSIPTTQGEMARKGIVIRKTSQVAPIPASTIEIEVTLNPGDGSFQQSILIVATDPVSSRSLKDLDLSYEEKATRTERSQKQKPTFSVIGKERERAYVAIEVLVGFDQMAIYHRYLLPVSEMQDEKG